MSFNWAWHHDFGSGAIPFSLLGKNSILLTVSLQIFRSFSPYVVYGVIHDCYLFMTRILCKGREYLLALVVCIGKPLKNRVQLCQSTLYFTFLVTRGLAVGGVWRGWRLTSKKQTPHHPSSGPQLSTAYKPSLSFSRKQYRTLFRFPAASKTVSR